MSETRAPLDKAGVQRELERIARWWLEHGPDAEHGGFVGTIEADGEVRRGANKGIVLTSRILWFFSALCREGGKAEHREAARRAYRYLREHFHDPEHGGVFWEVTADGGVVSDRKQTYALAFAIYACVAWHRACSDPEPLQRALGYFDRLERHVRDRRHGGYLEGLSRKWETIYDLRLGSGDMNAPKSANSHLHLLEAYTALYRAAPLPATEKALRHLLGLFCDRIAETPAGPLGTFFDSRWNRLSELQSFGHEIEASWLLWDAVDALQDERLSRRLRPLVLGLAESCLQHGVGDGGRVCEQRDRISGTRTEASVWWIQAEALVGFLNAFRMTGDGAYRCAADGVWEHIQARHLDRDRGEWHWWPPGECETDSPPYKAGFWKGPYHNGRAMMEVARMLAALEPS